MTLNQIPIGMEMFSAADEEQWVLVKKHIDDSDFYVLVIGHRYGSIIEDGPDAGISYTEKEYNYAVSKGVPVLAFFIDDDVPVKPRFVETENAEKLKRFKERVRTGREVVWWKSPEELVLKVSQSLALQINQNKRPGWIRAKSSEDSITTIINQRVYTGQPDEGMSKKKECLHNNDTKEKELYSIYLEDIIPFVSVIEVNGMEFPAEILNEIKALFTHMARFKVYGEDAEYNNAKKHIIRVQIYVRKYSCVLDEEYFQSFMNNQKRIGWKKKFVPDEIVKHNTIAKNLFLQAKNRETSYSADIDEILSLYTDAFLAYSEMRRLIDQYVGAL